MPARCGDPKAVHQRFSRWARGGVWQRVFAALGADADNEYAALDATIVRAHQHAAGAREKGATATRPSGAAGAG